MADDTKPTASDEPLGERQMKHVHDLRRILRFLATDERLSGMRDRTKVFGSAAKGKAVPGDIDIMVDFSDHAGDPHPYGIPGNGLLLSVASQFPGTFDPFVLVGKHLYVRNEQGNAWIGAKHARAIRKAATADGRPPADVYEEIRSRPVSMGGAKKPAEAAPDEPAAPTP